MSEKDIINEIDANTCGWRTGIKHCGDYECLLNKYCDLNCDWYKRRKLEQLLQAKEQECEEYKNVLDSLEQFCKENKQKIEIAKDIVIKYCEPYFKEKIEKEIFDFFYKAEE